VGDPLPNTDTAPEGEQGWDRLADALAATRFTDIRHTKETASTNADAMALAREHVPEGLVVLADHQTAGRGRLGRSWEAPPGSSLLVSILVRPSLAPADGHLVSTALGVAAAEACASQGVPARLKWPNDLVVTRSGSALKLCGMLAESLVEHGRVTALVLGIGINVNWPAELPAELAGIATAMNHVTGCDVSRPEVLVDLLSNFDRWYDELGEADGRGRLIGRYRELSSTIGTRVAVDLGAEVVVGDAVDIDIDGHLLVLEECPDRLREIVAGDVVHLRSAG